MRVTKKEIPMENKLIEKLDLCIKRITQDSPKLDAVLSLDGYEGYGKTTLSIACAYYVSQKTNRPFSEKNVFFNVEDLVKFAQNNKEQIIIWDEAALGGLSSEWWKDSQVNLTKLLMTCRKLRHFILINIPKIFKLNEYIALDRSLGLIHVYARNDVQLGRFVYFNRDYKEKLYEYYKKKRMRNYTNYTFRGSFPDVLNPNRDYNILDIFNANSYDEEKTKAIQSIGKKKKPESVLSKRQKIHLCKAFRLIKEKLGWTDEQIGNFFSMSRRNVNSYRNEDIGRHNGAE